MTIDSPEQSAKDKGMCPHGNFRETCGTCKELREQQPALSKADSLIAESKYQRSNIDGPNTRIERDGHQYSIEAIEQGDSKDIKKVQDLFVKTFGKEEVDPISVMRSAVDGTTAWGTKDITRYQINVIKNEKGDVQSTVAGGLVELQDASGKPSGEATFMIGYAVTDSDVRQGGLAREAYISALMGAAQEAQKRGLKLVSASGECTSTSEHFWNSIGWKRVYGEEKADPKTAQELQYVQPALDFSEKTGKVARDAGAAPEHLMLDSFGGKPLTKDNIIETVDAFYRWCNKWPREAFANDKAYQKHLEHVDGIMAKFQEQLDSLGDLKALSAAEREQLTKTGLKLKEHKAADHNSAGKEDF
ncbi:MAG: hypothetical protein ABI643_01655 [Candidatus Doudnabacteria bacterium]